jgi:hypothetical protein
MASFPVLPGIKTYIPWCCEEFADSGAVMGEDGLVGSLGGTYLITCTIPYSVDGVTGEVVGEVELFDGFGTPMQSVTIDRKTAIDDTLVMSTIVVAPESAVFKASVSHTFSGDLTVFAQSHMEICMLAPPSEVFTCAGWTIGIGGPNPCNNSPTYIVETDDVIISAVASFDECNNFDEIPGEATVYINGIAAITIDIPFTESPFTDSFTSPALNVPIVPGDEISFGVSTWIQGTMSITCTLPGANADVLMEWTICA